MTAQQKRFVEEFCRDGNGAAAAIRAGYAAKNARIVAYQLRQNEAVAKAIKARYEELSMSAEEAIKRVSDNAATRLNEFMSVEEVWETPMVRKSLPQLIAELELEIAIETEFCDRAGLTVKEQDKSFEAVQNLKRQIVRYQIELEKNPSASRVVKGEPVLVKKAYVDLIKLAKADEKGAIKKLSFNERGLPSVECYPADSALETILKVHGRLIQKIDGGVNIGVGNVDISKLTPEQKQALLALARTRQ